MNPNEKPHANDDKNKPTGTGKVGALKNMFEPKKDDSPVRSRAKTIFPVQSNKPVAPSNIKSEVKEENSNNKPLSHTKNDDNNNETKEDKPKDEFKRSSKTIAGPSKPKVTKQEEPKQLSIKERLEQMQQHSKSTNISMNPPPKKLNTGMMMMPIPQQQQPSTTNPILTSKTNPNPDSNPAPFNRMKSMFEGRLIPGMNPNQAKPTTQESDNPSSSSPITYSNQNNELDVIMNKPITNATKRKKAFKKFDADS